MSSNGQHGTESGILPRERLGALLEALRARGYEILGPTVRDQAIVYDEVRSEADLPVGWTEVREAGRYRIARRNDAAVFGYTVGPQSWKRQFHVPHERLWRIEQRDGKPRLVREPVETPRRALLGVRSCDLHAIAIQDRVLLEGPYADPRYAARREDVFVVAVNCAESGGTCFCASMHTGPRATFGYDLALTELLDEDGHRFLVEVGTDAGRELLLALGLGPAAPRDQDASAAATERAIRGMGRQMEEAGVPELLANTLEHPRWDDVAARCLSCTNCTMVCPTCFCSAVEDVSDLTGQSTTRTRRWDSCFNLDFTHLSGGAVRTTTRQRYRQWLTHKLGTWHAQFGTTGCVGCGRCITWCPVGIDLTEEIAALRVPPTRGAEGGAA